VLKSYDIAAKTLFVLNSYDMGEYYSSSRKRETEREKFFEM